MKKNAERDDEVVRMWKAGTALTAIGEQLGMSRSAVSGVVFRSRAISAVTPARKTAPYKPRAPKGTAKPGKAKGGFRLFRPGGGIPQPPRSLPAPRMALPAGGTATMLTLKPGQCKFPQWGDRFDLATSLYCGRSVDGEGSWCPAHNRLCCVGIPTRKAA